MNCFMNCVLAIEKNCNKPQSGGNTSASAPHSKFLSTWQQKLRYFVANLKVIHYLKLQYVSFASLSPSLFENLELQLCVELSTVRGVVLRHQRRLI